MKKMKKSKISLKIHSNDSIKKMQKKIDLLGTNGTYDASIFLNIRLFSSIVLFFVLLYLFKWGIVVAPIITVLYYIFLPKIVIDRKIEERAIKLDEEAMFFFEVLTLSLETGRSLKIALEITVNNVNGELKDEFKVAMDEMRYGKSLNEALDNLKLRIPSDTINNIILNIEESNTLGNSVIDIMYDGIEYIREKRIMDMKARINKVPLKVSVISVVFFIPLILLLLLAPTIIEFLN